MLRADSVSFGYSPAFLLADVSVEITPGSLTGLLGPNGCGKTTLLKLLCGVLRPQGGTIGLDGRPLASLTRRELARHVAVVPQETHPAFDYSVMEMVLMGRHPHLGAFQLEGPADFAIARESLIVTGTADLADRNYMTLSGGEKQRVIIASALCAGDRAAAARRADGVARSRLPARGRLIARASQSRAARDDGPRDA